MTAAATARPLPAPSELTRPFWEAAARHELVRPVCHACRSSFFTPQVVCPRCGSQDWTYEPSCGRGRVHSFTVVHRPPSRAFTAPYVVADVDVEEGWNLLTNIEGMEPADVRIGMPVTVRWLDVQPGVTLPVFGPEEVPT